VNVVELDLTRQTAPTGRPSNAMVRLSLRHLSAGASGPVDRNACTRTPQTGRHPPATRGGRAGVATDL
jgi:hypothetical protein